MLLNIVLSDTVTKDAYMIFVIHSFAAGYSFSVAQEKKCIKNTQAEKRVLHGVR